MLFGCRGNPMSAIPSINRLNSQYSTGPRTPEGKLRSSRNALRHGLTAASPVLPTEDPAAFETHRRQFLDEYQPANPTETHLVHELADTAWRLRRIPLLEARLISGHDSSPSSRPTASSPASTSNPHASRANSKTR